LEKAEIERLVGGPPRLALDDIIGHPRMPNARKTYLDHFLKVYSGNPFLVRLLIESGRFCVYMVVAVLEATEDPARRDTWLTLGRLKQGIAMFGLASDRHIDVLVRRLVAAGFLELNPSLVDRRVRILRPTERLRAHDRDWLAAHYAPLATLFPEHEYASVMQRDPEFHGLFRRISVPFLPMGAQALLGCPDILLFFNHAAGVLVLAALLQAAMAAEAPYAALSYGDVGDRFGVSRTHVRQTLIAAEEAGLVTLHGRGGGHVEILPRLWSSYDRGIAAGMYIHDLIYLAAERAAQLAGTRIGPK
jgi:DNA-binding transcriptional ArsR family regulator